MVHDTRSVAAVFAVRCSVFGVGTITSRYRDSHLAISSPPSCQLRQEQRWLLLRQPFVAGVRSHRHHRRSHRCRPRHRRALWQRRARGAGPRGGPGVPARGACRRGSCRHDGCGPASPSCAVPAGDGVWVGAGGAGAACGERRCGCAEWTAAELRAAAAGPAGHGGRGCRAGQGTGDGLHQDQVGGMWSWGEGGHDMCDMCGHHHVSVHVAVFLFVFGGGRGGGFSWLAWLFACFPFFCFDVVGGVA